MRCGLRLHGAATGAKSPRRCSLDRVQPDRGTQRAALAALPVRGARQGGWVRPRLEIARPASRQGAGRRGRGGGQPQVPPTALPGDRRAAEPGAASAPGRAAPLLTARPASCCGSLSHSEALMLRRPVNMHVQLQVALVWRCRALPCVHAHVTTPFGDVIKAGDPAQPQMWRARSCRRLWTRRRPQARRSPPRPTRPRTPPCWPTRHRPSERPRARAALPLPAPGMCTQQTIYVSRQAVGPVRQ